MFKTGMLLRRYSVQKGGCVRALVVDDSSAMRAVLRLLLKQCGFEVIEEARHGKDAITALIRTGPLELALVDWNMPEMSGLELLQAIRSKHEFDEMKVMMVTTETDMEQVKKALGGGADEYLMKPFNKESVAEKLRLLGFQG